MDQAIDIVDDRALNLDSVRNMLNVVNDSDIIVLLQFILNGEMKSAIENYRTLVSGMDTSSLINSLMDFVHAITCIKTIEQNSNVPQLVDLAKTTSLAALTRVWQMLVKGSEELKFCDCPEIVLEMIIMRICYASTLPDLHEVIEQVLAGRVETKREKKKEIATDLVSEAMKMFPGAKIQD